MKKDINSNKKKIITTIIIILVSLIMIVCIFAFFRNYQITKKEIGATESKSSTITIGDGSFVTEGDHNNEVSNLEWCNNSYNQIHAYAHGLNDQSKYDAGRPKRKVAQIDIHTKEIIFI